MLEAKQNQPLVSTPQRGAIIPKRFAGEYEETKNRRIMTDGTRRAKLADFLHLKRQNPTAPFGSSDKFFEKKGYFGQLVPGLKHAHLNDDISIVYRLRGNILYLYGFYKHDDLGTGEPPNIRKQRSMATRFSHAAFAEDFSNEINDLRDQLNP
jgi:hypothetical protein